MTNIKNKFLSLLVAGGVVLTLQTSCSKDTSEASSNSPTQKSAPTALDRNFADIEYFHEQYGNYSEGETYSYPTLDVDDAEWILEAGLNYLYKIDDWTGVDEYQIEYLPADSTLTTLSDYMGSAVVNSADLFDLFDAIKTESEAYSDLGPLSDIEIYMEGPSDARLVRSFGIINQAPVLFPPSKWPYTTDYHRSFMVTNNIKNRFWEGNAPNCGGSVGQNSWEILNHNLKVDRVYQVYPTPLMWVSINNYTYGVDPDEPADYVGPSNEDYSLDIYGAYPPIVNTNAIADGEYGQCLTSAQVQNFESTMGDIVDDHLSLTPNSQCLDLIINPQEQGVYDGANIYPRWTHHEYTLKIGVKL